MKTLAIVVIMLFMLASAARSQTIDTIQRQEYRVEIHAGLGPMYSIFRDRLIPPGSHKNTFGYQGLVRVMWHPDHLLAVGLLTGHQLISSERFSFKDFNKTIEVHAWLSATPIMIAVSMQGGGLEIGTGLGGYVMHSVLDDRERSSSSRLELGTLTHVSYALPLSPDLYLSPELSVNYLSYRGILSFAPKLELRYDIRY